MATAESNPYFVPSDKLKELRGFVKAWKNAGQHIGQAVDFRIVVDTNVVLADVRWLAYKRKDSSARTALIETIDAGTLDVYVPPSLQDEVEEHILRISIEEGLDHSRLTAVWNEYRKKLKILDPDKNVVQSYSDGVDPDDAVFIALAEVIGAVGVLTNDKHIAMMGGKKISIDCVLSMRDYSRATAVELHIKCAGAALCLASVATIKCLFDGIRAILVGISRAPDWLKITLVMGAAFCVLHPGARAKIAAGLRRALSGVQEATPVLVSHIVEVAMLAQKQSELAKSHLDEAMKELAVNESK
jgi:predicted nucleic acid-binding protein